MADEMEEIIADFVAESEETLDRVDPLFVELEAKGEDQEILNKLFRSVHTVKGAAGFLGFQPIVQVAHGAETIMKKVRDGEIALSRPLIDAVLKSVDMLRLLLRHVRDKDRIEENTAPVLEQQQQALAAATARTPEAPSEPASGKRRDEPREPPPAPAAAKDAGPAEQRGGEQPTDKQEALQTLRVPVAKIDRVMDQAGEMVLVRNRLLSLADRLGKRYGNDHDVQGLVEAVSFLDLVATDIQFSVMTMRMQPLEKVFNKFPRQVRDLSAQLGKNVLLRISGEDTEVDKAVIELIGDPLVHLIRNSIDHGLEPPAERTARGKPEQGRISIHAEQRGNNIIIELSDDGRGIDLERVRRKAVEKGLVSAEEAGRMSDENVMGLIFLPGFSTAEIATDLSGRGVGMDVVKTNITKLNGSVDVSSRPGVGTTFSIRIPLTLAVIPTLMVRSGGSQFALPLAPVEETQMITRKDLSDIAGMEALLVRGRVYPYFRLSDAIALSRTGAGDSRYAVIVTLGDKRFCLGVDELLGQEEVVIKTVSGVNGTAAHVLGATITGDGRVVFIIDLASLAKMVMGMAVR